nr:DDE-type integrase/transposase/recombinase [Photorhabdus asymbiotica]
MKSMKLVSRQARHSPCYTPATEEHPAIPNILAWQCMPQHPNQVWVGDMTFIWTGEHWSYLAVVMELYARRVVGWAMSVQPDTELVLSALERPGYPAGRCFSTRRVCSDCAQR